MDDEKQKIWIGFMEEFADVFEKMTVNALNKLYKLNIKETKGQKALDVKGFIGDYLNFSCNIIAALKKSFVECMEEDFLKTNKIVMNPSFRDLMSQIIMVCEPDQVKQKIQYIR